MRAPAGLDLGSFVILSENVAAVTAVQRLADQCVRGRISEPQLLTLHGPTSIGKTHLVTALIGQLLHSGSDRTAQKLSSRDLQARGLEEPQLSFAVWQNGWQTCDLLVIEDVHHLPGDSAEVLTQLLDQRARRQRPTVLTSRHGPARIHGWPARLRSRLAAGLTVAMRPLAGASRERLARELVGRRALHLADDVYPLLVEPMAGGVRPLLGLLAQLELLSHTLPPPLNAAVVYEHLPTLGKNATASQTNQEDLPVLRIVRHVGAWFQLTPRQLQQVDRRPDRLWPRQVAMYLARRLTGWSLARIGAAFGGKDHTTVLHACRKVEQTRANDPGVAQLLDQLEGELG